MAKTYRYSIKTIDGGRYNYDSDSPIQIQDMAMSEFAKLEMGSTSKYFMVKNIVSIDEEIIETED